MIDVFENMFEKIHSSLFVVIYYGSFKPEDVTKPDFIDSCKTTTLLLSLLDQEDFKIVHALCGQLKALTFDARMLCDKNDIFFERFSGLSSEASSAAAAITKLGGLTTLTDKYADKIYEYALLQQISRKTIEFFLQQNPTFHGKLITKEDCKRIFFIEDIHTLSRPISSYVELESAAEKGSITCLLNIS